MKNNTIFLQKSIILLLSMLVLCSVPYFYSRVVPLCAYSSAIIVYPIIKLYYTISSGAHSYTCELHGADLQKEIDDLRAKNASLVAKNSFLYAAMTYYAHIHELIMFKKKYDIMSNARVVRILTRHAAHEHYLLVDAGHIDGVKLDMVAVYHNALVGRVTEVYRWYSKVTLVTDKTCKVGAVCAGKKVIGVCKGTQHTTLQIDYAPHDGIIAVKDLIITSGQGLIYPYGLSLGRVVTIADNDGLSRAFIEPLFDMQQLQYCLLLDKSEIAL